MNTLCGWGMLASLVIVAVSVSPLQSPTVVIGYVGARLVGSTCTVPGTVPYGTGTFDGTD
jgi:hypothetical protein